MDLLLNTDFFIGYEVEGKYKGLKTLFVKGNQSIEKILEHIKTNDCEQVYFGAAMQSKFTEWFQIYKVKSFFPEIIVSIEILVDRDIHSIPIYIVEDKSIHKIFTLKRDFTFKNTSVKIENSCGIYCYPINDDTYIFNNWLQYKEDQKIEED